MGARPRDGIWIVYPSSGPHDAIAQHAAGLERELTRHGISARYRSAGARALVRRALARRDAWLFLEYMPYAYGRWGAAPGLVAAALVVRLVPGGPRLAVLVHEAPIPGAGWRTRLMRTWQRGQLRVVAVLTEQGFGSTQGNQRLLERLNGRTRARHLPSPSNVPYAGVPRDVARRRLGIPGDRLAVVIFGGRHPSRALQHLEAALAEVSRSGRPCTLINLGADAPSLDVPAAMTVIRPGPADAATLSTHLSAGDLYLAPFHDGTSTRRTTFAAALAHGLPVVGTDGAQTDGLLRARPAACRLTPAADVGAFAAAAADLAASPELREELSRGGLALSAQALSWEATGATVVGALGLRSTTAPGLLRPRARAILRNPAWAPDRARSVLRRRAERRIDRAQVLRGYARYATSSDELVCAAAGIDGAHIAALERELWLPAPMPGDDSPWGPRVPLLRLTGLIVAALRPGHVVETGVERGYSSAVVLQALEQAGAGTLHSIDLPRADLAPGAQIGAAVPAPLRHRWDLRLGPSRQVLPPLLDELPAVDVFLHDADHARAAQLEEFRSVWPRLRSGGVLIADDIASTSLLEFAADVGAEPRVVVRERFMDVIGVLVKP
jgi:Methyltransferase domain